MTAPEEDGGCPTEGGRVQDLHPFPFLQNWAFFLYLFFQDTPGQGMRTLGLQKRRLRHGSFPIPFHMSGEAYDVFLTIVLSHGCLLSP